MIEAVVPITIIFLSMIGIQRRDESDDFLSVKQGTCLRGLAALLLVVVHITERLPYRPVAYSALATVGYLLVSIFFFYSGYGITKKIGSDPNYLTKRLPKRIIYLIKTIIFSELIYYIAHVVLFKRETSVIDAIKCITGISMINGAMWTIFAMLVIQCTVYFWKGKLKGKGNYTLVSLAGCIIYIIITVLRNRGPWEMQSCCAFVIGAYIAENEERVKRVIKSGRWILPCSIAVFALSFSLPYIAELVFHNDYKVVRVVFGTISSCSFITIMLIVISKIRIGNKAISFIGSIATEIYLYHSLILDIVKQYIPNAYKYCIPTSFCLLAVVILISYSISKVEKIIPFIKR